MPIVLDGLEVYSCPMHSQALKQGLSSFCEPNNNCTKSARPAMSVPDCFELIWLISFFSNSYDEVEIVIPG